MSIHHGGGVGIGRSIHAGQVSVADGTELAAEKLARVLTNDPGMGVLRHVDAGYPRADEVATANGACGSRCGRAEVGSRAFDAHRGPTSAGRPRARPAATAGSPGPREDHVLREWFAAQARRADWI